MSTYIRLTVMLLLLLLSGALQAQTPATAPTAAAATEPAADGNVYLKRVRKPLTEVYQQVFTALENGGYFVVFEPNIGKNLENFAQRWGRDYNRNNLEAIRSMVFSNAWYTNQIGNADPVMLALCPLHLTLTYKDGVTTLLFVRPAPIAANSPAARVVKELEDDVINTLERIMFF